MSQSDETSKQPYFYCMVAPPGGGKSTYRQKILETRDCVVASTDDLIEAWGLEQDPPMNYTEAFRSVDFKEMQRKMVETMTAAFANNCDVILDRTNMRKKDRKNWLNKVPPHYKKIAVLCMPDRAELDRRLLVREQATGKHIPVDVVNNMLAGYTAPDRTEFDEIIKVV